MKIFDKNGIEILDVEVNDNSFRYRSIMKGDNVTLYYSLTEHVEIPVGSYIVLPDGGRYTLCKPENFTKKGSRNLEYTIVFDGDQELLKRYKYKFITKNPTDESVKTYQLKFPYTAKPKLFLSLLVDNLNLYNPKDIEEKYIWKIGDCIEASEKALSFNHEYCYDVLNRLSSEFNTEWEVEGRTIHLRKVEKYKDNPLPLSYGKGNGFKTGIGRQTQGDKPPVTRLYVEGGERNINYLDYGSKTLLLPLDKEIKYEERSYKTDPEGTYIWRLDKQAADINEDSFDASHIYPKWEGEIEEIIEADEEKHIYRFKIKDPATQPDFTDMRMPDEKATLIFQSGLLTGLEFDLSQDKDKITGYDHQKGIFQIEKLETGGIILPNSSLRMEPKDRFGVFHIKLPSEYICDDVNKKGGSWDMFKEAARYMYEHEEEQFSFTGELDGIWAKKNWLKIGGKITPGGYVEFSDTQFQPEGILIRITGVKDLLNNPHSPEIELSNISVGGFVSSDLGKIEENEVVVENNHKEAIEYTKRRWRDAEEMLSMLEKAIDGFSEGIKPIWVQAMSLLVGDESLQFKFVEKNNTSRTVEPNYNYNQETKTFKVTYPSGTSLLHLTLGGKNVSPTAREENQKSWDLKGTIYESRGISNPNPLYLYLKCKKEGSNVAEDFELTPDAHKLEESGYYYFLIGVLSSEYEGERSFVTVYGFTEILPGRINVDKIISTDGKQYWDMANRAFKIGDDNSYIGYNINRDNQLVLRGSIYQSPSGDKDHPEVDRGTWSSSVNIYYPGDKVQYDGNVYKCIRIASGSISPENVSYWKKLVSKGEKGDDGLPGPGNEVVYFATNTLNPVFEPMKSDPRDNYLPNSSGWSSTPERYGYKYLYISRRKKSNGEWGPWSYPTLFSQEAPPGPALLFRGEYTFTGGQSGVFYNNINRRDAIKYSNKYYIYKGINGRTVNVFNSGEWEEFGAQFESVATGLLLAEKANIAGWNFNDKWIWSQDNNIVLNGNKPISEDNLPVIAIGNGAMNTNLTVNKKAALKLWRNGTVTVGDGLEDSTAGITGEGNSANSVRFWAGSTFKDKGTAKFRVQQDGKLYAKDGIFEGEIIATKGTFSGDVTVENLKGWKVPGVIGIYHIGGIYKNIYTTGNFVVAEVKRIDTGTYTLYHTIGHTNYSVIHVGATREGDKMSFLGSSRCNSISNNSVTLFFKDTDNNAHNLDNYAAVDFIFISYHGQ